MNFESLWKNACEDPAPNPRGAVGLLVQALAGRLDVEEVEYDQIGRAALFLLDLSSLGFKGMDLNVLMVTHEAIDEEEERAQRALLAQYKQAVQSVGFCFHLILTAQHVRTSPSDSGPPEFLLLTGSDIEHIFESRVPKSALFGVVRRQVDLVSLCPFNVTEVARGAMFKGRKVELDRLTHELDRTFVITGARRVGKSSLLRKAFDLLRMRPHLREGRVVFFNCLTWGDYWDCAQNLAHRIDPRRELRMTKYRHNVSYMLREASKGGSKPLLLFLDEMDAVVESDFAAEWPFFRMLREAVAEGYVRVCLAGYRSMSRLVHDGSARSNKDFREACSPFYGAMEHLRLTQLNRPETDSLIVGPLREMDIRIVDEDYLTRDIWRATKGFPFLTQFYGEHLFNLAMRRSPPTVEAGDVALLSRSREISRFLELHFLDNTRVASVPIKQERVCAFLHATRSRGEPWTKGDFLGHCQDIGVLMTIDELSDALENLVDASIFECVGMRYGITFQGLADQLRESYGDAKSYLRSLGGL